MKNGSDLSEIETFFLALADKTRLRILNLMRSGEISVSSFSTILKISQPKVSRHLAYMRNAGLVDTRRDGKCIYYGIRLPSDQYAQAALDSILGWLASQPRMAAEHRRLWGTDDNALGMFEQDVYYTSAETYMTDERPDELEIYLL